MGLQEEGTMVETSLVAIRDSICFLAPALGDNDLANKAFGHLMLIMKDKGLRQRVYEVMF